MADDKDAGKWITQERALIGACVLLVASVGSLIGVWTSKIEHTVARVDLHDQRFSTGDARLTIQEHDTKRIFEILAERELRIRELEGKLAQLHH